MATVAVEKKNTEKKKVHENHCADCQKVHNTNRVCQPSALRSIIAGSTAGAVEIGENHCKVGLRNRQLLTILTAITYPAECSFLNLWR